MEEGDKYRPAENEMVVVI